jgi:tetratricopeptide (TPR) repeat protein
MAHYNLATALRRKGSLEAAIRSYRAALSLRPGFYEAHNNLGGAMFEKGDLDSAIYHWRQAMAIRPRGHRPRYNLAVALARKGDLAEAIVHYREVIEIKPDLVQAYRGLAWLLATSCEQAVRDGAEALRLAAKARDLGGETPRVLDALAAAYAETGRFDLAISTLRRAISLAEARARGDLADTYRQRLKLYSSGKPFRARGMMDAR